MNSKKLAQTAVAGALAASLSGPVQADDAIGSQIGNYLRGQNMVIVNGDFQKTIGDIIKFQLSKKPDDGTLKGLMEKAIDQAGEVVKIGQKNLATTQPTRIVIDNTVADQVLVVDPAARTFAILPTKEVDYQAMANYTSRVGAKPPAMVLDESKPAMIYHSASVTISEEAVRENCRTAVALQNQLRARGMSAY